MRHATGLLLLLAACGPNPPKFIEKVVELDCDYIQACEDDAILTFTGWNDRATCISDAVLRWEDRTSGECEYDKKAAKACLKALEDYAATCPRDDDGAPMLPEACLATHLNCTGPATDDSGDETANETGETE